MQFGDMYLVKVVRDRVHETFAHETHVVRYASVGECAITDEQRRLLLFGKLLEEIGEYVAASGDDERVEELSDIIDVAYALGKFSNSGEQGINECRKRKNQARGGFDRIMGLWAEEIV